MACEDCAKRDAEEILDNLEYAERVNRNQGLVLVAIVIVLLALIVRLNAKGVLSYSELLDG